MKLTCGDLTLDLSSPCVMGILNVTPDSFSDGGRYDSLSEALKRVELMISDGAKIIDIGGESTRPGASPVSLSEEMSRVVPVVEAIRKRFDVVVSVDTSSPEVMISAASAGAGLLNDVRALTRSRALESAAQTQLPVCLMHMQGQPSNMQNLPQYDSVIDEVRAFFQQRIDACEKAGIPRYRLLLDPGFGFGKSLDHNLELLHGLSIFTDFERPVLVGMSRKSMIGLLTEKSVDERLFGSVAAAAIAVMNGAKIVRAHDVAATVDAVKVASGVIGVKSHG